MIAVERRGGAAGAAELDAALAAMKDEPGVWMGCDVQADGLFRKESTACSVPALRFALQGAELLVAPMGPAGAGLIPWLGSLARFEASGGVLKLRVSQGKAVLDILRRFLGGFQPRSRELALYGALSFDYYRLGDEAPLPDDGRCRMVLYFPQQVLVDGEEGVRRIDFSFGSAQVGAAVAIPEVPAGDIPEDLPEGVHAANVDKGIALLREGTLYSLVLSQAFYRRTTVPADKAFAALRARNPYPGMFFCNLGGGELLFGASPDLQVRADGACVEAAPVCGTYRRGDDPLEDEAQANALLGSAKESAALVLCADSAANELAMSCEPGSVELLSHRRPYYFSTIIHAIDHLRGRRREGVDAFDILLAHATPATVTGLPKQAAIAAIEALEPGWRGWYAGAVARIGSDGSVEAYTVLRAARVVAGIAEIRCGGNLVVDSDPKAEEQETRLKAQTLFRVLEGTAAAGKPSRAAPVLRRVRWIESDDAFRERMIDALARAGASVHAGGKVFILSGRPRDSSIPEEVPLLAIGEGGKWLLEQAGAQFETLSSPQFGRPVRAMAVPGRALESLGELQPGWYAASAIREAMLPAGWNASALTPHGHVIAAERDSPRACALLFRPDSVLSLRAGTGMRAIESALARLDPYGILAGDNKKEEAR